jgi:hypothetical protein
MKTTSSNYFVAVVGHVTLNTEKHVGYTELGDKAEHDKIPLAGDTEKKNLQSGLEDKMMVQVQQNLCIHEVQPCVTDCLKEKMEGNCPC